MKWKPNSPRSAPYCMISLYSCSFIRNPINRSHCLYNNNDNNNTLFFLFSFNYFLILFFFIIYFLCVTCFDFEFQPESIKSKIPKQIYFKIMAFWLVYLFVCLFVLFRFSSSSFWHFRETKRHFAFLLLS